MNNQFTNQHRKKGKQKMIYYFYVNKISYRIIKTNNKKLLKKGLKLEFLHN